MERRFRFPAIPPLLADGLLFLVLVAIGISTFRALGEIDTGDEGLLIRQDALGYVVFLAGTAPVLVRRRWPFATTLLTGTVYATLAITDEADRTAWLLAVLACAYMLAAHGEPRARRIGFWFLVVVAVVSATVGMRAYYDRSEALAGLRYGAFELAVFATVWYIGSEVRRRRLEGDRLEVRATHAEERAETAAAHERTRIARELHDLVGHAISVISVQATVGEHLAESNPAQAKAALGTIQEMSKQAMVEMRHLVGVLREDERAELEPQPGLGDLEGLIETARTGGADVSLRRGGVPVVDSPGIGLTVYRIVQEALSNADKHAPGAAVRIDVEGRADEVVIAVENDAPAASATRKLDQLGSSGFGLAGMRERVAVYDGTLEATRTESGGFRVRACLPYGDEAPSTVRRSADDTAQEGMR